MKFLIAFIATLLVFYLIGSFIAASFVITEWHAEGRVFLALFGTYVAVMVGAIGFDD